MRILLIVPPEREDFYDYLRQDRETEYVLLWHEKKVRDQKQNSFFKEEYYWSDFGTPLRLIRSIKPDKIVFFEIIDQRQIALIVTANSQAVSTFYLEHGAASSPDTAIERSKANANFYKKRANYILKRLFFGFRAFMKTKFFYFSALRYTNSFRSAVKYVRLPIAMLYNTPNKALRENTFPERVPRNAITFNEKNFEEYALYTDARPESAVLTGIPMFDRYHQAKLTVPESGFVYIEHPYLEENLLNWNAAHHKNIAHSLAKFANETKTSLLVKLHPRSELKRWQSYNLESEYFEIVQHGDFIDRYLSAKLILGFSSSLIAGMLCAKKNIVLLGWHPEPRIFGADFSKTGLCHTSLHIGDLFTNQNEWLTNNLSVKQTELYATFLKKNNYPFDGRAAERVVHAIRTL